MFTIYKYHCLPNRELNLTQQGNRIERKYRASVALHGVVKFLTQFISPAAAIACELPTTYVCQIIETILARAAIARTNEKLLYTLFETK